MMGVGVREGKRQWSVVRGRKGLRTGDGVNKKALRDLRSNGELKLEVESCEGRR